MAARVPCSTPMRRIRQRVCRPREEATTKAEPSRSCSPKSGGDARNQSTLSRGTSSPTSTPGFGDGLARIVPGAICPGAQIASQLAGVHRPDLACSVGAWGGSHTVVATVSRLVRSATDSAVGSLVRCADGRGLAWDGVDERIGREDRPMPGPGELPSQQPARIIGREAGLATLRGLVDPVPQASQVLLVTGEAGMGKTGRLADAAGRARSAGMRVLAVTGRESESRLAFAGLHQLLRPVLSSAAGLPARQAHALLGALGLAADPGPPDPLLTGVAVLTLLSDLSEHSPVLVVADDVHWLDRSSLEALAFAGRPLEAEPIVVLVGERG